VLHSMCFFLGFWHSAGCFPLTPYHTLTTQHPLAAA